MAQIVAYITFNGNCREAMTFYKDVFGGDLNLMTVAGSPIESQCPASMKNSIMHSSLVSGDITIMATEMMGPDGLHPGDNIALMLNCKSEDEINSLYNKLSDGGQIIDPLSKKFWGDTFGVVNDKFGIRWMFNYASPR